MNGKETMNAICSKICERKEALGLTWGDVSEMSGVPVETIQYIVAKATPKAGFMNVYQVTKTLGVEL